MYRSPIEVMLADIQHQISQQQDEEIYKAVVSVGINVDKDELIRALQYDRGQYQKGYFDGVEAATPRWIPVTERLPEPGVRVLVSIGAVFEAFVDNQGKWQRYYSAPLNEVLGQPTHWMPLPEPPNGGVI